MNSAMNANNPAMRARNEDERMAKPRWVGVPVRALLVTFLFTVLSFALALLLSILGTIVYSQMKGIAPNLTFAYRHIAFPIAITAGAIVLLLSLGMEIRNYRQRKTLAGIERAS
jgi:branched-subunit amino acid ABC-type transport system permease component